MTNEKLMKEFLNGATKGKAGNLKIEGSRLIQYDTTIAQFINGQVVINITKYSQTTTVLQNKLKSWMPETVMLDGVKLGSWDLRSYMIEPA